MPYFPSFRLSTVSIDNIGSEARDFCAIERTFLSELRLGILLGLLSASLLLNARLPDPTPGSPPTRDHAYSDPLGIIYFVAAIGTLLIGMFNYERLWKGLSRGTAFVQSSRLFTAVMTLVALLIIITIIILLVQS